MSKFHILFILFGFCGYDVQANNIQITGLNLQITDPVKQLATLEFSLSWENSWKTGGANGNHDAAWIFAKFSHNKGPWQHLHFAASGHEGKSSVPVEVRAELVDKTTTYHPLNNPVAGIFVHRTAFGSGKMTIAKLTLRWNYSFDIPDPEASIDVQVFAIEMVYIPEGSFYAGDGSSYGTFRGVASNQPLQIGDFPTVIKCEDTGYCDAQLEGSGIWIHGTKGISQNSDRAVNVNSNFPTGYQAFYCMKYEVSQKQYADFLNTLTPTQASTRVFAGSGSGYTIHQEGGRYVSDTPDRPNNWMDWADAMAYADWACLRPMTELEYEKASRGLLAPVAGEYAWGNAKIVTYAYTVGHSGTSQSSISNLDSHNGNCAYNISSPYGPLRSGIFAEARNNSRTRAGASVWGVMELSGNVVERCVSLGHPQGRYFTGLCGDGILDSLGDADVADWPCSDAAGAGFRGGSWAFGAEPCRVSDRREASIDYALRFDDIGFRGMR